MNKALSPREKANIRIGLPFFELSLRWGDGMERTLYFEAHFSPSLRERAVMLIVKKDKDDEFSNVIVEKFLPFKVETGSELLDLFWGFYQELKREVSSAKEVDQSKDKESFIRGFSISESLRFIFGGLLSGPPRPELHEPNTRKILIGFYEEVLFRNAERPRILREEKRVVPFIYDINNNSVLYVGGRKSRFKHTATILTDLLRKRLISVPI